MGAGPVTVPTPQDCYYDAQSQTVGPVEPLDMIPGKSAWCLLTKKGNLVWLHLLSGGGYGDAIPLRLELMQWKKINVSPAPK